MKKAKFVVIDGLDGSGKTTQVGLLAEYFKNLQRPFFQIKFPQYEKTFFGSLARRYLKGEFGSTEEVSPYLASLTLAGDRWQAKDEIEAALKKGKFVVSDRYVSSNIGFMGAKIGLRKKQDQFISWLEKLEYGVYKIPKEDLLIYLSVTPEVGQKLVFSRKGEKPDIHEIDLTYLKKVEKVYLRLLKRFNHWFKIDCLDKKGKLMSKEAIHQQIIVLLKNKKIL